MNCSRISEDPKINAKFSILFSKYQESNQRTIQNKGVSNKGFEYIDVNIITYYKYFIYLHFKPIYITD